MLSFVALLRRVHGTKVVHLSSQRRAASYFWLTSSKPRRRVRPLGSSLLHSTCDTAQMENPAMVVVYSYRSIFVDVKSVAFKTFKRSCIRHFFKISVKSSYLVALALKIAW